jgi:hypothetical protein
LITRLAAAAKRAAQPSIENFASAVVAGSGEFLARRLAGRLVGRDGRVISLKESWGPVASSAGCASAVVRLAAQRFRPDGPKLRDNRTGLCVEAIPE